MLRLLEDRCLNLRDCRYINMIRRTLAIIAISEALASRLLLRGSIIAYASNQLRNKE